MSVQHWRWLLLERERQIIPKLWLLFRFEVPFNFQSQNLADFPHLLKELAALLNLSRLSHGPQPQSKLLMLHVLAV